jgi:hypothetical protein
MDRPAMLTIMLSRSAQPPGRCAAAAATGTASSTEMQKA